MCVCVFVCVFVFVFVCFRIANFYKCKANIFTWARVSARPMQKAS